MVAHTYNVSTEGWRPPSATATLRATNADTDISPLPPPSPCPSKVLACSPRPHPSQDPFLLSPIILVPLVCVTRFSPSWPHLPPSHTTTITLLSHRTCLSSLSGHQDASRYCGPSQPCSMIHLVNIYSPFLSPKQLSEVVITRVLPSWGVYFNRSRRSPNLNTYKQSSVEPWSLPRGGHSSCLREANASTAAGNNLETWKSSISECRQRLKSAVKELDHQGKNWHSNLSLPTSFTKTALHMYVYLLARLPKQKTRNSGAALLHVLGQERLHKNHYILTEERKKKSGDKCFHLLHVRYFIFL